MCFSLWMFSTWVRLLFCPNQSDVSIYPQWHFKWHASCSNCCKSCFSECPKKWRESKLMFLSYKCSWDSWCSCVDLNTNWIYWKLQLPHRCWCHRRPVTLHFTCLSAKTHIIYLITSSISPSGRFRTSWDIVVKQWAKHSMTVTVTFDWLYSRLCLCQLWRYPLRACLWYCSYKKRTYCSDNQKTWCLQPRLSAVQTHKHYTSTN